MEAIGKLKKVFAEIHDLRMAQSLLEWDMRTYMPRDGTAERAAQIATLGRLAHEGLIGDGLGAALEDAQKEANSLEPDSDGALLVRRLSLHLEKKRKVATEWVEEKNRAKTVSTKAWEKAKEEADFEQFSPHLKTLVELAHQYAEFFAPYDDIYDPFLDDYEIGMKTSQVESVFNELRPEQVKLVQEIGTREQIDDSVLHQTFDDKAQWDFGVEIARLIGYDFHRGRQDRSVHPFSIHFGPGDVRITTEIKKNYFSAGFFATLHEAGHALYEQGVDRRLSRTILAEGTSLGIHESQSRLWENLVGRSKPFWEWAYPMALKSFPGQLDGVGMEAFYRAVNKVEPSLIRIYADEATYNLHIMLRFELERALLSGEVEVADLPTVWNDRMKDYLGITPPDDAQGVLQDVHWSEGLFGYFPTYALGNLMASQIWEVIQKDLPDLPGQIGQGQFTPLLDWLREHIHRHGAKFLPMEIIQQVTGDGLSAQPYLKDLRSKFGAIYGLS